MKLGIALGGGGARGSAHIGALRELYALGIRPDLIAGTSIGAFIGAMICAGLSLDEAEKWLRKIKPSSMYALPDNEPGIASQGKLEKMMVDMFAEHFGDRFAGREDQRPRFEDLEIPLAVIATDLVTQREVVIDSGDLIRAVRASISIPVLFPPVEIDGWKLVDGGLMNNLPFDVTRARGATHTIAIDLGNSSPYGTPPAAGEERNSRNLFGMHFSDMLDGSLFDRALLQATQDPLWHVVTTVMDIVGNNGVRLRLAMSAPDVLLRPDIGTIGLLDFHTIDSGIEAGRQAVRRQAPAIEKMLTLMSDAGHLEAPTPDA